MIVIVDYGRGNVGSIRNMFDRIDVPAIVSRNVADINAANRLLLPGVGAFDAGITSLRQAGLEEVLRRRVLEDCIPTLGICLGMQLMTRGSEEGCEAGLGWVPATTESLSNGRESLRLPHMGWNFVEPTRNHALCDLPKEPRFYFAHTYHVRCDEMADVLFRTWYEDVEFVSGYARDNIVGLQFHPEKSHRFGKAMLQAFAEWAP